MGLDAAESGSAPVPGSIFEGFGGMLGDAATGGRDDSEPSAWIDSVELAASIALHVLKSGNGTNLPYCGVARNVSFWG